VDWTATTPRSQQVILIAEHSSLFITYLFFSFTELLNEELRLVFLTMCLTGESHIQRDEICGHVTCMEEMRNAFGILVGTAGIGTTLKA